MPKKHILASNFVLCILLALLVACSFWLPAEKSYQCTLTAKPWPEATRLFRGDARWLGGDGASSVDLGEGRVLWLFGDSFVCGNGPCDRRGAALVRNSIAVQSGYDPSRASIAFYWGSDDGKPASFFPEKGASWYWPGGGVLTDGKLVIFLMEIRISGNALGFEGAGWSAVVVDNPRAPPGEWHVRDARVPEQDFGVIIGCANVLREGDYLYAFGVAAATHEVFLVRWPASSIGLADLSAPEWWTGPREGWKSAALLHELPSPVFTEGQMEFTVHRDERCGGYIMVQTKSLLDPSLVVRRAARLTGPWSTAEVIFTPEEAGRPDLLVYAGKAHPALHGADCVFTYNVNTTNEEKLYNDTGIYYPFVLSGVRVVRLP